MKRAGGSGNRQRQWALAYLNLSVSSSFQRRIDGRPGARLRRVDGMRQDLHGRRQEFLPHP